VREVEDEGVTKLIYRLHDGHEIESVVIPMTHHTTLCISCQVGCRMRCRFCETGRMGFYRNLTVEEIVGQVYTAKIVLGISVRNIVFMGMGEPFDNFDAVIQAIRVMNDPRGLNIAHSHITVSTAGRIDGIRKLAALNWPRLNLAVSLNAPGDTIRSQLMPINRQFSMDDLRQALADYPLRKSGCFLVEYVLIKGINDAKEHAGELARFLKPLRVRLNLIAFNPGPVSCFKPPSEAGLHRFRDWLVKEKVFVRLRSSRGQKIMAACGQLGNIN
jgi:23S rRNA (adenine2503-C2)-methyltransferase